MTIETQPKLVGPSVRLHAMPGHEVGRVPLVVGETIATHVRRARWAKAMDDGSWEFRLPTICTVNGSPVLQREWTRYQLRADDQVIFLSRPMGGGGGNGKSVLGLVAVVALAAFAPWAGGAIAGALTLPGAGGLIANAISARGSVLIT